MEKRIYVPEHFDTIGGEEVSFADVHQWYAQSRLGKTMGEEIRYHRYKPDSISRDQWCALFGPDVNALEHGAHTADLAKEYLRRQDSEKALTLSDSQVLVLASLTHDWAECIVDDKTYDVKTDEDRKLEAEMAMLMLRRFFNGKLSPDHLKLIFETFTDRKTRLGEIFNAIERIGYLKTGVVAWDASEMPEGNVIPGGIDIKDEEELRMALKWMSSNILANQIPALVKYAGKFNPVNVYMGEVRGRVEDMFRGMPVQVFERYPSDEKSGNEMSQQFQKYMAAREAWKKSRFHETIGEAKDVKAA